MIKPYKNVFSETFINLFGDENDYETPPNFELTDEHIVKGMTSLFYEGGLYKGRKNRIYAYYKTPEGQPPLGGWPSVVLVHGGGGTAFAWMVEAWNQKGFAAIAMDLEGHLPELDISHELRSVHDRSGPTRKGCFEDSQLPIEEQWFYHGVIDVVLAHSLIRSFKDIHADKIGIFGISWGGIITCTVMGLDHRFNFGISAYGCGFYSESDGMLKPEGDDGRQWDPSRFLEASTSPMLFLNGSKDKHFPLNTWQKTTALVSGPLWRYIDVNLGHDHVQPYGIQEPFIFAAGAVSDRLSTATFIKMNTEANKLQFHIEGLEALKTATLFYTTDQGLHSERSWLREEVEINQTTITVDYPNGATAYFINVTNDQGHTFSSSYYETVN